MSTELNKYQKLAEELLLPRNLPSGDPENPIKVEENPTITKYLKILDRGLEGKTDSDKKVVIVGAGIAGMLAGIVLADYGLKVTIIEANDDRVGGRVKTFGHVGKRSPFAKGQYAEAGAMRFPEKHPLLMAYIKKFDLEDKKQEFYNVSVKNPNLSPDAPKEERSANQINTSFIRTNSFQTRKNEYADNPLEINEGFGKSSSDTAGKLLDAALDVARDYYSEVKDGVRYDKSPREAWRDGWARLIEDFDKYTLGGFLREKAKLDENTIDLIGTLENLTSRMPLSFIHSFLGRSDINPNNKYYELQGGSWQLTDQLLKIIDGRDDIELLMDHRMTHIHYYDKNNEVTQPGYTVHASNEPGNIISVRAINESGEEQEPVKGDLAIITIPFSSLRFVRTAPDFSYGKRRAIIELHYDSATKVLLEFDKRWWEWDKNKWMEELDILLKSGKITPQQFDDYKKELEPLQAGRPAMHAHGGGSVTDNPNRGMYYPSHRVVTGDDTLEGGVILASYTWSDDARRWDSMADKDRYDFALRGLANIHGEKIRPFFSGKLNGDWVLKEGCIRKGAATQSWARSPYAFGEAAVFQAYQMTTLHPDIPTPEGPVHFAGEHTSLKHAWLEGSLESAIRVAEEIKEVVDPKQK